MPTVRPAPISPDFSPTELWTVHSCPQPPMTQSGRSLYSPTARIDKAGKLSSIGWLRYAERYSEGLAVISKDAGVSPTLGSYDIDFDNYDYQANKFNEIQFQVIDRSANKLFSKKLTLFNNFSDGLASAWLNGKCGYITVRRTPMPTCLKFSDSQSCFC